MTGKPFGSALRRHLLTGALIIFPVGVTAWLIYAIARFVVGAFHIGVFPVSYVGLITDQVWLRKLLMSAFEFGNFLAGLVITFVALIIVGALVRTFVGKKLMAFWESVIERIPFIRGVYGAMKQLTEAIFMTGEKSFSRVVLVEYPRKDCWCIGFVTGDPPPSVVLATRTPDEKMLNIFVPSTPNPTTGWYLVLPEKEVKSLDMSVEDAFKLIISGGLASTLEQNGGRV